MTTRTRIQPLDRSFSLALDEMLEPSARSKQFAAFAAEEIEKAADENRRLFGRDVERSVFVDGREGIPLENVSPTGTIVARFEIGQEALDFIGENLVKASPVSTGQFARSHIMLADGVEVVPGEEVPPADEYVFVNTQPYSRKLEGDGRRSPLSAQAPQGVYDVVAAMAARRFGNIARITFGWATFAALGSSALEDWARASDAASGSRLRRQPAIFVRFS